jgi:hypothetical protein
MKQNRTVALKLYQYNKKQGDHCSTRIIHFAYKVCITIWYTETDEELIKQTVTIEHLYVNMVDEAVKAN